MEKIDRHLGEELYKVRTTILCFEKILALPDTRFYSQETREFYQKGLGSAHEDWSDLKRQIEQIPLSHRKQSLDLSSSPNRRELKYHRRALLTANDNFSCLHNPSMLYGKGDMRIKNLRIMRDNFKQALAELDFSDLYKAKIRHRIRQIEKALFVKQKIKGDTVGIVECVKVYVPTDFWQVKY